MNTQNETVLKDDNIGKLLVKLSVPATIGMLVMSLYNVVDTIFIGKGVGTDGIAGVALAFPIQMVVGAIGMMIGIGGASLLSRSLGEGNIDKAQKTMGNVVGSVMLCGLVFTVIGYAKLDDMLRLFGATETLMPYAREYVSIVMAGVMAHSLAMALNNLARAEGHARVAMTTMIVASVVNVILDAILIFSFKMGIRGAAVATLTAYISAALFLIVFFRSGKSILKLRIADIGFERSIMKEILSIGVASFIRQTASSLLIILLNRRLGQLGGDISIAVYGVLMRLLMLVFTPIMGIAQGLQPVAGFNYGARNFPNMKKSVKLAMIASTAVAVSGTLVLLLIPVPLLRLFSNDPELIAQGRNALRLVIMAFPLIGFQVMGTTLFQATGKAFQNLLLTLSRQVLFLIPLILIMPRFFHLSGLWVSFPIADILASALTLFMLIQSRHLYRPQPVHPSGGIDDQA